MSLYTDDDVETVARVLHNAEWELDSEEQQEEFLDQARSILDAVLPAYRERLILGLVEEWVAWRVDEGPGPQTTPGWLRAKAEETP